ncbi:hypothetical protein BJ980_000352 [Nocardioides daedukensis]|uniref:Uncharacterized protein n=1 Tax=Nocardioides daedukensis TaxID=634462 RepID=A0A7Y9S0D6_9ACTN|nr:hypothetical protein [Nocardioides daedukensis]NYG57429.1 hypothetical protein [Nocardioides daedukensis]
MRSLALALVLVLVTGVASACSESEDDRREAYCEQVKKDSAELTRITDEGGQSAFVTALPILDGLAEKSPSDLKDEWQALTNALHGLDDALKETGLEPADVDGELPDGLSAAERRTVIGAASVLASDEVLAATEGIEQHALDICGTALL